MARRIIRFLHRPAVRPTTNTNQPANPPVNPPANQNTNPDPPQGFKWPESKDWVKLAITFFLPLIIYGIVFLALRLGGVSILLSLLIGYFLSLIVLLYIKFVFEDSSGMGAAIFSILTLVLLMSLALNFVPALEKKAQQDDDYENKFSESGTVKNIGDIWFSDAVFTPGTKVEIEVSYNEVFMVSGDTLKPGLYPKEVKEKGKLMFEGVVDAPAKIKIRKK